MGTASKVCSVIFRFFQLASAAIVAGLVGQYLHYVDVANGIADSRLVYTIVIAGISLLFSLIYMPPFRYSFYGFPVDFVLFIAWIVAFGLLENLTVGRDCRSQWYWTSWGYYWGGYWTLVPAASATETLVGTVACSKWHCVLAFCFLGSAFWFASGLLGLFNSLNLTDENTSKNHFHDGAEPKIEKTPGGVPSETNHSMA